MFVVLRIFVDFSFDIFRSRSVIFFEQNGEQLKFMSHLGFLRGSVTVRRQVSFNLIDSWFEPILLRPLTIAESHMVCRYHSFINELKWIF